MALAEYGPNISLLSGKVGGIVYSHNRSGPYVRLKGFPVNPNTDRQLVIKNLMTNLTSIWISTVTEVQRQAWNLYGQSVAMTNRLGRTIYLTGFTHYTRSNISRMQAGLDRIDDGPVDYALPASDPAIGVVATASDDGLSIAYNNALPWAGETGGALLCFGGQPRSPSRNFFDGPYRLIGAVLGVTGTPPTSPEALTSAFQLAEGQLVGCQFRICRADGRLSAPFRFTDEVAA